MTTATLPQPQASPAREMLCEALTDVQIAREAVTDAEAIAARAIADLNRAGETLKSFEGLDKRIADFRVLALKGGKWSGWPSDLQAQRLEKLSAVEECEHAAAAARTLNSELETARESLTAADRRFDQAAFDVFSEVITQVVTQLDECNRQREYLRLVLQGAALPAGVPGQWQLLQPQQRKLILQNISHKVGFPHGDAQRWEILHRLAAEAGYPASVPERTDAIATSAAYWKAFAAALHDDPDAEPGPLPSRETILA